MLDKARGKEKMSCEILKRSHRNVKFFTWSLWRRCLINRSCFCNTQHDTRKKEGHWKRTKRNWPFSNDKNWYRYGKFDDLYVNRLTFKHQNCNSKSEFEQKIMRQILTTSSMKAYVGNGPKKSVLRLYLARKQVCPDILE